MAEVIGLASRRPAIKSAIEAETAELRQEAVRFRADLSRYGGRVATQMLSVNR